MKTFYLLSALLFFGLVLSCSKKDGATPATLAAKWSVVSDSTAMGVGAVFPKTYIGVSGDYFDFRADGKCYIKEGAKYDTLSYKILTDTTLNIATFGYGNSAFYTKLTDPFNKVTLTSGGPYPPGGINFRQVKLKR